MHVASLNAIEIWAQDIPQYAIELARAFWPGPMTLILRRSDVAKDFITGFQDSVGIRVPSNPIALALLSQFESLGGWVLLRQVQIAMGKFRQHQHMM